jgi:hypothetical protein
MRFVMRLLVSSACLLAAAVSVPAVRAAAPAPGDGEVPPNVRISIELGRIAAGGKTSATSYQIVVAANGEAAEMESNSRVPIPTTVFNTSKADGDKIVPVTSFTYQNVGFTARLRVSVDPGSRLLVSGKVDSSFILDGQTGGDPAQPPRIESLSQELNLLLHDGKPLRVTTIGDGGTGSLYMEIKAELLR